MADDEHRTARALEAPSSGIPPHLLWLVPAGADALLVRLREHFAGEPLVAVLVERRASTLHRHTAQRATARQRRAPVVERDPLRAMPGELRGQSHHVRFVQRLAPVRRTHESTSTSELIRRSRAMEPEAVSELWWRHCPRVLERLALHLGQRAAETVLLDVLGRMLDELDGYDPEDRSLDAWVDSVVDRYASERGRDEPAAAASTRN